MLTTGCSYVSDSIESAITERSSFSIDATYNGVNTVTITWDKTDSSSNFAGIEIYRTKYRDDEYSDYELIMSKYRNRTGGAGDGSLGSGSTTSFSDTDLPPSDGNGVYFYRVGFIHWDEDPGDRTNSNGYFPAETDNESNYNSNTDIDSISGYSRVVIN